MNANQVLMPGDSGSFDFYALAKESGYSMNELIEVAEILQTRLRRPAEQQEILIELSGRYLPKPQPTSTDFYDFFPEM